MCPTRALEVIADLTYLPLVIDREAHEAIIRKSKLGAGNDKIRIQKFWFSLNNQITSANLSSYVVIKKVSIQRN